MCAYGCGGTIILCKDIIVKCLFYPIAVSSTQVNSFGDLFHGEITGNNESDQYSMTDSFLVEVNKSVTFWLYTK